VLVLCGFGNLRAQCMSVSGCFFRDGLGTRAASELLYVGSNPHSTVSLNERRLFGGFEACKEQIRH